MIAQIVLKDLNKMETKIEKEFDKLINSLTDEEWWTYVRSWFDTEYIQDIMTNWDDSIKEDAITDLKEILNKRNLIQTA